MYENEEDQKTILESDLQENHEELITCVQFEEQKEEEQSVQSEDPNNLETELFYEEFSEDLECKDNTRTEDKTVLKFTKCKSNPIISVSKEADEASKIAMSNFFLNICNTVSTLPILHQAKIKKQVFDIVSEAEISYLTEQSMHK